MALGIQNAMRMRPFVICDQPGCTLFFTLSHKRHDFRIKKELVNIKICFDFRYKFCLKLFSL